MAISGGDVKFTFTGDASDLNKELGKVSGNLDGVVGSAQGAANDLDRKLGPAAKNAGNRIEGMSEQSGDADSILQGLAASLDMVNPALGDAARFAGDAAGGLEAVGRATFLLNPMFLAAAAAAAAVAFAFVEAAEAAEEAEAAVEAAAEAASKAEAAYGSFKDAINDTADAYRLQIGEVTELELAIRDATGAVEEQPRAGVLETTTAIVNMERKLEAMQAERKAQRLNAEEIEKAMAAERALFLQIEKKKDQQEALEAQRDTALLQAEAALLMADQEEKDREEAAENAKRRAAAKAAADKAERQNQAEILKIEKERAAMNETIANAQRAANSDQMTDQERIAEGYRKEIEALNKILESEVATAEQKAEAQRALDEVEKRIQREQAAREAEVEAERTAMERKALEESIALMEEKRSQTLGATTALVGSIGDITQQAIENQGEAAGEGAQVLFRINQAAALAGIAINTAEGISKSMTLLPPANAINAAAVIAAGATAAATIAAAQPPTFHSGAAPDEVNARLMRGEAVLNASAVSAVGGDEGVSALNAGTAAPGEAMAFMFKHRLFDAVVKDNVRRTGSPLRKAIQGDRLVGQAAR